MRGGLGDLGPARSLAPLRLHPSGRPPATTQVGLWENGYGYTARLFGATAFAGTFERARMLVGDPGARLVGFVLSDDQHHALLPADLDGPAPPIGTPQPFVGMVDGAWGFAAPYDHDTLIVWQFAVKILHLRAVDVHRVGSPRSRCGRVLLRLQPLRLYPQLRSPARNRGRAGCHLRPPDVPAPNAESGAAGGRWSWRTRSTSTAPTTPACAGTSCATPERDGPSSRPEPMHRMRTTVSWATSPWTGMGNLMAGFSVSGGTVFPSIRVAGRLASDPPGVLAQGETEMVTGGGSQLHSASRWGDSTLSSSSVDPVDDCTFWYTQEYLQTTGQAPVADPHRGDPLPELHRRPDRYPRRDGDRCRDRCTGRRRPGLSGPWVDDAERSIGGLVPRRAGRVL